MSLDDLTNNPFILTKQNGESVSFKGLLNASTITTFDSMLSIDVGDHVERVLPNGKVEQYVVRDAGFNSGLPPDINAFYKIRVARQGVEATPSHVPAVTNVYNVQGPNARVNLNSIDSSRNVANVNEGELFTKLCVAIECGVSDSTQKARMLENASALQSAVGTSMFAERFQVFLSGAANCMTVLTPFLPALSQFATSSPS